MSPWYQTITFESLAVSGERSLPTCVSCLQGHRATEGEQREKKQYMPVILLVKVSEFSLIPYYHQTQSYPCNILSVRTAAVSCADILAVSQGIWQGWQFHLEEMQAGIAN